MCKASQWNIIQLASKWCK